MFMVCILCYHILTRVVYDIHYRLVNRTVLVFHPVPKRVCHRHKHVDCPVFGNVDQNVCRYTYMCPDSLYPFRIYLPQLDALRVAFIFCLDD